MISGRRAIIMGERAAASAMDQWRLLHPFRRHMLHRKSSAIRPCFPAAIRFPRQPGSSFFLQPGSILIFTRLPPRHTSRSSSDSFRAACYHARAACYTARAACYHARAACYHARAACYHARAACYFILFFLHICLFLIFYSFFSKLPLRIEPAFVWRSGS